MKRENSFDFEKDYLSYDDIERIVQRARRERDAAVGRAIRSIALMMATGYRQMGRAIDEAVRLRALSMLNDRQLAACGLDRAGLPAFVYGWRTADPAADAPVLLTREIETAPVTPDSIAA